MMCLEFRQRLRSIYGKNSPTPATQFAMSMGVHLSSTALTPPRHTGHPNTKQTSWLFFFGGGVRKGDTPLQRRRCRFYFANAQGERDVAITGNTPPRCNPRLRRCFLGT